MLSGSKTQEAGAEVGAKLQPAHTPSPEEMGVCAGSYLVQGAHFRKREQKREHKRERKREQIGRKREQAVDGAQW